MTLIVSAEVGSFSFLNDVGVDLVDMECLHILEEVEILRPETHELIECLLLPLPPYLPLFTLLHVLFRFLGRQGRGVRWGDKGTLSHWGLLGEGAFVGECEFEFGLIYDVGVFYLCGRTIVIDDAYLLGFNHVLSDDVIKSIVIVHTLHPLLRVDGSAWADKTPLSVKRGHSGVLSGVPLSDL